MLKYQDYVEILNCFFVYDCLKNLLPNSFKNMFSYIEHRYGTRSKSNKNLKLPSIKTTTYGLRSITYKITETWNKHINKNVISEDMKRNELKRVLYNFFISKYILN